MPMVAVDSNVDVATSSDGLSWVSATTPPIWPTNNFISLAEGNGKLVLLTGGTNQGSGTINVSSDNGKTWTRTVAATLGPNRGVGFGNGLFVAVGDGGSISTSPDGITWTTRTTPTTSAYQSVAWDGTYFVVIGGSGVTAYSTDGITWTAGSTLSNFGMYIAAKPGNFVASTLTTGNVYRNNSHSSAGWGLVLSSATARLTVANNRFFASPSGIYYSDDGITWTAATSGGINAQEVAYCVESGLYICGSASGNMYQSSTGTSGWTSFNPGRFGTFNVNLVRSVGISGTGDSVGILAA